MYNDFYRFTGKPFQLNPDPQFFFGSKGHNRAMSYLDYGMSQEEGFIVITGEIGAGKTTLVRRLCGALDPARVTVAHVVNTTLCGDDILRMVAAGFGLSFDKIGKAALLLRLEHFLQQCHVERRRPLLIVDEAQNLTREALEELRMLSNLQAGGRPLLQTFLLGQPEFRAVLLDDSLLQLRQRVIAACHLGPLDAAETRSYIEHRLQTVGWQGDPRIADDAFAAIHAASEGIPRRINTLCDRLFLMGFLEGLHAFDASHVAAVVADIEQEFAAPLPRDSRMTATTAAAPGSALDGLQPGELGEIEERVSRMESSVGMLLDLIRKMLPVQRTKGATAKTP